MNTLDRSKKYFYTSLVFLVISLCLLGGVLWYLNTKAETFGGILRTIAEQSMINEQFNSLSETVENSTTERDFLNEVIITGEAGVVEFLSNIDGLAAMYNVALETSALKVIEEEGQPFKQLSLTVAVEGSRGGVERFIKALEVLPYAKKITTLRISKMVSVDNSVTTFGTVGLKVVMK